MEGGDRKALAPGADLSKRHRAHGVRVGGGQVREPTAENRWPLAGIVKASQDRADRKFWLQERRKYAVPSEVSARLGLNPWKSLYALYMEKAGLFEPDETESEVQRWGIKLEGIICEEYALETGRKVIDHGRYAIRASETCPGQSCTLDREIEPCDGKDGPGALEAKNASAYKVDDWSDGAPLLYQVQIHAQLEVTGWTWGSAAALIGGNTFRWCDVARDERFIEMMRGKVAEFWKMVKDGTPPPVDGSASTAEVLRRLYPGDSGETVALDAQAAEWSELIARADADIKAAEEVKAEAKNKLIAAIGSATFGVLPDGTRYSFKTTTRKESIVNASKYRTLRRVK